MAGGWLGVLAGVATAVAVDRGLRRLEPAASRRRRLPRRRTLPLAADLLAVTLRGGAPVDRATLAVAEAVPGPLGGAARPGGADPVAGRYAGGGLGGAGAGARRPSAWYRGGAQRGAREPRSPRRSAGSPTICAPTGRSPRTRPPAAPGS